MPSIASLDLLPILVAAVAGYALGGIWFMPTLFGNAWMKALGKTPDQLGSAAQAMSVTAVTTVLTTATLAWVLRGLGIATAGEALVVGIAIGLGVVGATMLSDALFLGWSRGLFWIQASYRILYVIVVCTILGALS